MANPTEQKQRAVATSDGETDLAIAKVAINLQPPAPHMPDDVQHGNDAVKLDNYQLILDTLERSNVLLWWARVWRDGSTFNWKIRTPPQLRDNPIYRMAALVKEGGLWKDEQAPDNERTKLNAIRALEQGAPGYQQEFPIIAADGVHWLSEEVTIRPAGPNEWDLAGVIVDVSARHKAEDEIREQNEILSKAHEGVMIVDLATKISFWNRGAEEIFGWTAAEALGRSPESLLKSEDPKRVNEMRAAVQRDGYWNGELRLRNRDGHALVVDHRITLVRDEKGNPRARLSFLVDVTEKKILEEKFLRSQRLENIGMLAAGIAHDLNNVLTPILFAEPLLRESLSRQRDLRILDTVKQCAARGAGLVKHILGFAHGAAGEFQPVQVKHIVRDIIGMVEETFPRSIELQKDVPSDLWSVSGNATQIHQVLLNLCVNARDAMPKGGKLRVSAANRRLDAAEAGVIPGSRPGMWVVLEVSDTGTGIPPDVLEHLWTPFFSTKGIGKGTGLGLSTIKGIVTAHHGFVELETAVGRGSKFRVFLPAEEVKTSQTGSASPFELPIGHGELILFVDDDAPIRNIGAAILRRHGYHVVTCIDGVEAIAAFIARAEEFSLVITDIDMPRMGGTELARALTLIRPEIRILAMSGIPSKETEGASIAAAKKITHGFLSKPFQVAVLLGAVNGQLHPTGT